MVATGAVIIVLIRGVREFKFYQLAYDFKTIESQMEEKETVSMPEYNFYITRDYMISVNGTLKVLKRNSILKIEETKMTVTSYLKKAFPEKITW